MVTQTIAESQKLATKCDSYYLSPLLPIPDAPQYQLAHWFRLLMQDLSPDHYGFSRLWLAHYFSLSPLLTLVLLHPDYQPYLPLVGWLLPSFICLLQQRA